MPAGGSEDFRSHNVRFLQEQNREALRTLERVEEERDEAFQAVQQWEAKKKSVEAEYKRLEDQVTGAQNNCDVSRAEIHRRDEQIRVLMEQNRNLLDMLEQEEASCKEKTTTWEALTAELKRLEAVSIEYERVKAAGDQQLTQARSEVVRANEELKGANAETEQLRSAATNYAAQAKADIEGLEMQLNEAKKQNVEYLQQINANEVSEHKAQELVQKLKETLEDLTLQKKSLRMQLDGDASQRDAWSKSKADVEQRKETLSRTVEALRASLRATEDAGQKMQEDQQEGGKNFRLLSDKVYSLMEQLRVNQVDLKKQEQAAIDKEKKIALLDKQASMLQSRVAAEVSAKLEAEAEARSAAQMQALLQKKHKKLEEAITLALKAQEKVEKRQQELNDKANALHAQNEYLATRIDGQEEDKGALRQELRKLETDLHKVTETHAELSGAHTELEDKINEVEAGKTSLEAELDYIKREDMLDATGRTKPILIESNESMLVERLQINEFLYGAQQQRNPVPMLIEKLSHLLELLHTAQRQADLYLQDLQRSNSLLTALRDKNRVLYDRTQTCETWKMRALLKIVSNEFEKRPLPPGHIQRGGGHSLYLDGLQYNLTELQELQKVITSYGKQEELTEIRLQENQLDAMSLPELESMMAMCPYLTRFDLRRNRLDEDSINRLQTFLERIQGVTNVQVDPATGNLIAKSGNQVRLTICLEDQNPTEPLPSGTGQVTADLSMTAADDFLNTAAGLTGQTRLQGPEATGSPQMLGAVPQRASLANQTQLPQRASLSESRSDATLPRLGSTATLPRPSQGLPPISSARRGIDASPHPRPG